MSATAKLLVEKGANHGTEWMVEAAGARLGRASANDFVVDDPLLSRHHCRFYFKPGDGLWIADLGSANETLVDGIAITDAPLHRDSVVSVGDTTLRVLADGRADAMAPVVDLGFKSPAAGRPTTGRRPHGRSLILTAALVTIAVASIWAIKVMNERPLPDPPAPPAPPPVDLTLSVEYEKIEATRDNIFAYRMRIAPDSTLAIEIDDLANGRTVREQTVVEAALLDDIASFIRESDFHSLDPVYRGVNPDTHNRYDLSVTIGRDTHRCVVLNRPEPDAFQRVRERLEDFGQVELGLWAVQFSTERLIEMAEEAYLLGKKLYAERLIEYGNLAGAIKSMREAAWYLETVDPKPDFYTDIRTTRATAEAELEQRYIDQNFRAERALKLRDWQNAATELRILLQMIPDRGDPRHTEARRRLMEVTPRLEERRR